MKINGNRIAVGFAAALLGASLLAFPALGALKQQVVCTEAEPAKSPTHFRFENGGSQPEIIFEVDYAKAPGSGKWEAGHTYVISIDDNAERIAPAANAMFSSQAECTSVSKSAFRLEVAGTGVTSVCSLSWEDDPSPAVSPWTKAGRYSVQIVDLAQAGPTGTADVEH
jgi:hypothetical protein